MYSNMLLSKAEQMTDELHRICLLRKFDVYEREKSAPLWRCKQDWSGYALRLTIYQAQRP